MLKTRVIAKTVTEPPPGLWSNCVMVGDIAYVSGLTARVSAGAQMPKGEYDQAKLIFDRMRALVESAGGTMDDMVKLTIFVTNIAQNAEVWRARREFFTGDFPACSLVEVRALALPEILVEIEGIAHLGSSADAA